MAPGVGKDTDIVVIGPGLGSALKVEDRHIAGLEKIYEKSRSRSAKIINTAVDETKEFVQRVRQEYEAKAKEKSEESAGAVSTEPKQSTG